MAEYVRAQKILFAQAERVSIIRAGLKSYGFEQQPEEFVNLLSNILFVLTPLAELVPRHQVAARSLHSSMRSITLIQQGFAKIETISILPNCSKHEEYMEKLLQLDLVKDLKTMVAKERTALVAKVDQAHEASKDLALASSEAAGAFEMAVGGLKLMAGDLKDGWPHPDRMGSGVTAEELGSLERYVLATGLLMNHLVRDLARFYKTTVMACLAVACAMAFLAFFYACYLENVYENEGVARAFDTEPKERQGCCWKCDVHRLRLPPHRSGFYALMLLQDAVSLILVFLTLMMGTISLAQIGVASGCQSAEILSDDAACVKELGELGNFVDADLLQQRSCHDAGLLICESMMANVAMLGALRRRNRRGMVSHTLLLAVLGTILSCCIPRRLLVVWMSTQHNVAMAEVLADSDRGGKPMDYSAYSKAWDATGSLEINGLEALLPTLKVPLLDDAEREVQVEVLKQAEVLHIPAGGFASLRRRFARASEELEKLRSRHEKSPLDCSMQARKRRGQDSLDQAVAEHLEGDCFGASRGVLERFVVHEDAVLLVLHADQLRSATERCEAQRRAQRGEMLQRSLGDEEVAQRLLPLFRQDLGSGGAAGAATSLLVLPQTSFCYRWRNFRLICLKERYHKGTVLVKAGAMPSSLWLIVSGQCSQVNEADSKDVRGRFRRGSLGILEAGQFVGLSSLLFQRREPLTVTCASEGNRLQVYALRAEHLSVAKLTPKVVEVLKSALQAKGAYLAQRMETLNALPARLDAKAERLRDELQRARVPLILDSPFLRRKHQVLLPGAHAWSLRSSQRVSGVRGDQGPSFGIAWLAELKTWVSLGGTSHGRRHWFWRKRLQTLVEHVDSGNAIFGVE
eukprot:g14894.t1